MRTLVLGASNETRLVGYVPALVRNYGHVVDNRSLGASSSTAGIFNLLKTDCGSPDIAVLSYDITEQTAYAMGLISEERIRENWSYLFWHCRSHGATPIVMILPIFKEQKPIRTKMHDMHRELAINHRAYYLDLADVFIEAAAEGADPTSLMDDPLHMSGSASTIVASALNKAMLAIGELQTVIGVEAHHGSLLRLVRAKDLVPPSALQERHSSAVHAVHARVTTEAPLRIPVGPDEKVQAIVLNMGALGAVAVIEGGQARTVKSLVLFTPDQPDRFLSLVVDIRDATVGALSGLTLSVLPENSEPSEPTIMSKAALPGRYGELEIESFLLSSVEKFTKNRLISRRPGLELDLWKQVDRAEFVKSLRNISKR